jgi:four helix bundle protein
MADYKTYKDLDVWIRTRGLVKEIYLLTKEFPKEEMYGLSSQMRRSAVSIPSNIAEGYGRKSKNETIHFLHIARGSLYELETQLYISFDLGYTNAGKLNTLTTIFEECRKLLSGLINYFISNENLK